MNPADWGTRGTEIEDLIPDSLWFKGPEILYQTTESIENPQIPDLPEEDKELKQSQVHIKTLQTKQDFIGFENYSSWSKLVAVMGWIKRFISNCKIRIKKEKEINLSNLTSNEIRRAEEETEKIVQKEVYFKEIKLIEENQQLHKQSHLIKFSPFLDENGVLRVGGRLKNAKLLYSAMHQMILPSNHQISKLLIAHFQKKYAHCGRKYLLGIIRQTFWIIKGRSLLRSLLAKCIICKKRKAKSSSTIMGNLPKGRLAINSPPFCETGVDYFGPIKVKILRSTIKRWGCIFTCMTTRAIHLEVADSLSTDSFINTLERFMNRRGQPKTIYSDCGSNFKGANNELAQELGKLQQDEVGKFACRRGFDWKFNPPSAPHMGGVWERMIRTVKNSLSTILQDQLVSDFTLITVFTEVEALVNSRPITHVSDDIEDLEALTPNHFLLGRASANLSPAYSYDNDISHRKRWKRAQALTNHFWPRWLREYLPTVTTKSKWTEVSSNIKVGDLVLVLEKDTQRGKYPLARVTDVFPGDDGMVRVVNVKTKNGIFRRPITKLCLLDGV